jgi:dihydrofolate synthase/folylpolyglutamate synthase
MVVLNAAHNPAGARAAAAAVPEVFGSGRRLIGVVGASADKDVEDCWRPSNRSSPRS